MSCTFQIVLEGATVYDNEIIDSDSMEWRKNVGPYGLRFAPHLEPVLGFKAHTEDGNVGTHFHGDASEVMEAINRVRFGAMATSNINEKDRCFILIGILCFLYTIKASGTKAHLLWS